MYIVETETGSFENICSNRISGHYGYVHEELKRVGVTLKILWQEYQEQCRASGSIPMGYTKYCKGAVLLL